MAGRCENCPRALTPNERKAGLDRCEVCRGLRRGSNSHMTISVPKKEASEKPNQPGLSWWAGKSREELSAEAQRRAVGSSDGRPPNFWGAESQRRPFA